MLRIISILLIGLNIGVANAQIGDPNKGQYVNSFYKSVLPMFDVVDTDTHVKKYTEQRLALANTKGFSPYRLAALEFGAEEKWKNLIFAKKDYHLAELEVQGLLKEYPLSIGARFMLALTYNAMYKSTPDSEAEKKAELRKKYFSNLLEFAMMVQSVKGGTTCKSMEDGCKVITISEEYWVMYALGYQILSKDKKLDIPEKIAFDIFNVKGAAEQDTFYFDFWLLTPGNPNANHSIGTNQP